MNYCVVSLVLMICTITTRIYRRSKFGMESPDTDWVEPRIGCVWIGFICKKIYLFASQICFLTLFFFLLFQSPSNVTYIISRKKMLQ